MTSGSTTSTSGAVNRGSGAHEPSYTGRAVRRFEDADLLRGHGRFGDDLPVRPDTLHAAILRSPHAHAEILSVDVVGALAVPGVDCVVTSEDARRWTRPFAVAVKTAMEQWCLAIDRVRYVGEPVAVVLARNRDTAEDALDQIADAEGADIGDGWGRNAGRRHRDQPRQPVGGAQALGDAIVPRHPIALPTANLLVRSEPIYAGVRHRRLERAPETPDRRRRPRRPPPFRVYDGAPSTRSTRNGGRSRR